MGKNTRALSSYGLVGVQQRLINRAKVGVSPGIGFGNYGDEYVRICLIENEHRIRQAIRGIRNMFKEDGLIK